MKIIRSFIYAIAAAGLLASCDNDSSTLGNTLVSDQTEVVIDSSFVAKVVSYRNTAVPSRTVNQLLGSVYAKEFGSITSDFVTQLMPAAQLDTAGVKANDIDSVKLILSYTAQSFTGDSLVPMGLKIYPLTRQLTAPIYSDFNPEDYYDKSKCWTPTSQIYTANDLANDSDSSSLYRTVAIDLPVEFGREVFNKYLTSPSTFATPEAFSQFFPGLYVVNSFGSGRIMSFSSTTVRFYYRKHAQYTNTANQLRDTIYQKTGAYLGVTPEIISNNIVNLAISEQIHNKVQQGSPIVAAPLGYNIRLTFPLQEIMSTYRSNAGDMSVINTLSMQIPVETIANSYSIAPPTNMLLVLEKDEKSFFANNKINDDKTSFLATYDAKNQCYSFTGLRQYLIDMLKKSDIAPEDYTFCLIPVDVTTESSDNNYYYGSSATVYITGIQPYLSKPAMCLLQTDQIKIRFTYSKQFANNL